MSEFKGITGPGKYRRGNGTIGTILERNADSFAVAEYPWKDETGGIYGDHGRYYVGGSDDQDFIAGPLSDGEPQEMAGLTFSALRDANKRRLPQFKNRRGQPAHSEPDGSDWCLAQWCNAVTGELGEAANLIKKIERGDMTLDEARNDLGKELADVQTYLDILAFRAGVDLGAATVSKFNEVSERVGSDVRLPASAIVKPEPRRETRKIRLAMLSNGGLSQWSGAFPTGPADPAIIAFIERDIEFVHGEGL